ncbi:MAG: hypothetical protein RLY43_2425, partial [Bacteroidota bacterium]
MRNLHKHLHPMQKIFLFSILLFSQLIFCQEKFTLSGTIKDTKSNETIIGATLQISNSAMQRTIQSNEYGFYSISLQKGSYEIVINALGFEPISEKINLNSNLKKEFYLTEKNKEIEEVVISTNSKSIKIDKPEMSVNKLSIAQIKQMPAILGEVDIIKS